MNITRRKVGCSLGPWVLKRTSAVPLQRTPVTTKVLILAGLLKVASRNMPVAGRQSPVASRQSQSPVAPLHRRRQC